MDYGFAPGGTPFDIAAGKYFEWRNASKHLFTLDPTIESFVSELTTSSFVNRPVRNLGIGCHGSWIGLLEITLDSTSGPRALYGQVARASTAGTIRIPPSVLDPRPSLGGVPLKAVLRILGCEIGAAVPYLTKLKDAFGGDVMIVATHHEDSVTSANVGGQDGVLRVLLYDFRVWRPTELTTKTEVIDAFHAKNFKWYDGTNIERSAWEDWHVPDDVRAISKSSSNRWADFSPAISGEQSMLLQSARWEHTHEPVGPFRTGPTSMGLSSADQRRAFMRTHLSGHNALQPWHPFPLYKSRGYATFDEFIDGYDWWPDASGTLWNGYRHVYRINRAISVPPNTRQVLYDWVTPSGVGEHLGLPETDSRFFTTV